MLPIYIYRENHDEVNAIHNIGFTINYITTAIGSVLINRLVSYIYNDDTNENPMNDEIDLAERGEYTKNITRKSVEEIVENGEYTLYKIL